eukprot:GEMP01038025.1.p1 GENE.GEMP01038025.1~~GEMP01038025.1.p1  ORF type:complete len:101 (+),score=1.16 GEMP01038025.1:1392-1694(+)
MLLFESRIFLPLPYCSHALTFLLFPHPHPHISSPPAQFPFPSRVIFSQRLRERVSLGTFRIEENCFPGGISNIYEIGSSVPSPLSFHDQFTRNFHNVPLG